MKWKLKMGVYCTFLLGTINIIFCLVRFITIQTSTVDNVIPLSLVGVYHPSPEVYQANTYPLQSFGALSTATSVL